MYSSRRGRVAPIRGFSQLAKQPRPRQPALALDGAGRSAEDLCGFLDRQADEEPQLHDYCLLDVQRGEAVERLEGVETIAVSQSQQTAVVTFDGVPHGFSPQEFRAAVAEADVEVLRFEVDACGQLEGTGPTRWFIAGPDRFALSGNRLDGVSATCLTATLDDSSQPYALAAVRLLTNQR